MKGLEQDPFPGETQPQVPSDSVGPKERRRGGGGHRQKPPTRQELFLWLLL